MEKIISKQDDGFLLWLAMHLLNRISTEEKFLPLYDMFLRELKNPLLDELVKQETYRKIKVQASFLNFRIKFFFCPLSKWQFLEWKLNMLAVTIYAISFFLFVIIQIRTTTELYGLLLVSNWDKCYRNWNYLSNYLELFTVLKVSD